MWSGNFARQIVVLSFLILYFNASSSRALQVSTGSAAPIAAGQSASPQDTKTQRQTPASPQKSSAGESKSIDDENIPEIPGAKVRVLKEGEKVPERKDPDYEDWSKPELKPGVMQMNAIMLGTVKGDGFTRELWTVQWREFDPIDLWVIKPAGAKNPPVILYLYSYDGSNERYKNDDYCKFLTRDGFAAVGFVSALTGQRFHDRPRIQTFVSELQEALGTTTHDVQMILNYLEKRGDLDTNHVGMWADGSGAAIAIMASAVDARIKALDLLDPWGDWPEWAAKSTLVRDDQRAVYIKYYELHLADLEPLKYFPKVKALKVRLQYIKDGISVTPAVVREKIEAASPPNAEIVHYEDKKAFLSGVAAKGIGFDWIKANLSISNPPSETRDRTKAPLEGKITQSR